MSADEAFVPLEAWLYHSPDIAKASRKADIGLLAEALVFYGHVYFAFTSEEELSKVILWFKSQGASADLIDLLRDRVLIPSDLVHARRNGH